MYQVEKLIRENRDKLAESDIKPVEEAIEVCRKALADNNVDAMHSATQQLETALTSLPRPCIRPRRHPPRQARAPQVHRVTEVRNPLRMTEQNPARARGM